VLCRRRAAFSQSDAFLHDPAREPSSSAQISSADGRVAGGPADSGLGPLTTLLPHSAHRLPVLFSPADLAGSRLRPYGHPPVSDVYRKGMDWRDVPEALPSAAARAWGFTLAGAESHATVEQLPGGIEVTGMPGKSRAERLCGRSAAGVCLPWCASGCYARTASLPDVTRPGARAAGHAVAAPALQGLREGILSAPPPLDNGPIPLLAEHPGERCPVQVSDLRRGHDPQTAEPRSSRTGPPGAWPPPL
jgi:hypothetical protein